MLVLIGSRAIEYWCNDFRKVGPDYDFIGTKEEFKSLVTRLIQDGNRLVELKFIEGTNKAYAKFSKFIIDMSMVDVDGPLRESDAEIYEYAKHRFGCIFLKELDNYFMLSTLELNFVLKESHKFKKNSPHFLKTMQDLEFLRRFTNENIINVYLREVLDRRKKATYNYQHPKLNTSKQEFFTDSVPYQYDHDTIHEAVKHLDKPAYQYYMQDDAQVMCSSDKFFAQPEIVRLYGVLEESYVLALERAVIPHGTNPERAFEIALEKVCTSITSGWFREYAYENYFKVKNMYHASYVDKFNRALYNNQIKPFKESSYAK
jgi:hypothetical protein